MKIDHHLQRTDSKNLKDQTPIEKARDGAGKTGQEKPVAGPLKVDTVTISEQARSLQRAQNASQGMQARDDSIRPDKVKAARTMIQSGALMSDKVVEKTAEAILESGDLGDIINARRLTAGLGGSGVDRLSDDPNRLDEIRQRVQSGFYNSPEVTDRIAESMMDDLLA